MFISHTLYIIVFLPCLGHNYVSVPSLIIKTSFHMPFPWHTRHARVMSLASTLYYWEKISNIYRNVYEISNERFCLAESRATRILDNPSLTSPAHPSIVCCCNKVHKPTYIFVNNQQLSSSIRIIITILI